jgi:hypothetical protein
MRKSIASLAPAEEKESEETTDYEQLYTEVFVEASFDQLPPRCEWDHLIKTVSEARPPRGRRYPFVA